MSTSRSPGTAACANQPVRNFSLRIEPGTSLAVTGPSGIGKTTMISLMCRFSDPLEGTITIDGQDLRDLTPSFKRRFSICTQNQLFFNDSIINNLRLANPEKYFIREEVVDDIGTNLSVPRFVPRSQEIEPEIVELVRRFGLYEKIMQLPDGFAFMIGEHGVNLSGGERQKLNLIRTFLKDADFYLFDEPTNFLNNLQFDNFLQLVREYCQRGKTVVVMTHELSVAAALDAIVCFSRDGSFEYGSHAQLLERRGFYANIWARDHS